MLTNFHLATLAQVAVSGLALGSLYAIALLGVLIVFQVSKSINFAYGQIGMVAAFGSFFLYTTAHLPVWLAVGLGVAAAVALSALTDFLIIRRIAHRQGLDFVVTLGELLLLTSLAELLLGTSAQSYLPLLSDVSWRVGGVFINANDLLAVALGIACIGAGAFVLRHTTLGISLRAAAEDPAIAQSVGISVPALRTATWAVSGLLIAVAAMMFASRLSVSSFYMTPIIINVFIAGMIGGLERFWPPIAAAFFIAVYQAVINYLFGEAGGVPALFLLVIAALSLIPKRFLDERREARA
jgi:branched-chain amino acid transport system permease protein